MQPPQVHHNCIDFHSAPTGFAAGFDPTPKKKSAECRCGVTAFWGLQKVEDFGQEKTIQAHQRFCMLLPTANQSVSSE